jgi:hypothetical protein
VVHHLGDAGDRHQDPDVTRVETRQIRQEAAGDETVENGERAGHPAQPADGGQRGIQRAGPAQAEPPLRGSRPPQLLQIAGGGRGRITPVVADHSRHRFGEGGNLVVRRHGRSHT